MIRKHAEIFCWKNVSSFCSAKATHIFSAKNMRILYIESAKTVNEMTHNELVKLTTLRTTGPWYFTYFSVKSYTGYSLAAPHCIMHIFKLELFKKKQQKKKHVPDPPPPPLPLSSYTAIRKRKECLRKKHLTIYFIVVISILSFNIFQWYNSFIYHDLNMRSCKKSLLPIL